MITLCNQQAAGEGPRFFHPLQRRRLAFAVPEECGAEALAHHPRGARQQLARRAETLLPQ